MAVSHDQLANAIRALSMDAVQRANSGHPGMPMGMADVATVLFSEFLNFDPETPEWPDRDRFILSAGHGSMLLYALLYLTGYEDMTIEEIKNFRQLGSRTAGHPEYGYAGGIETTTGPLGQGLANAVGMAIAEQMLAARFGSDIVDHYTYVIAGDGCLMEGISHEAISMAGHLGLGKLVVLFDDNNISIDGGTELSVSDNQIKRFEASGWDAQAIDGHDPAQIRQAIAKAKTSGKPSLIACKTTIAYGAPTKAGTSASHGAPLGDEEIAGARKALGWEAEPFDVPADILNAWRECGKQGQAKREAWQNRLDLSEHKDAFLAGQEGLNQEALQDAVWQTKQSWAIEKPAWATRKSSGEALGKLVPHLPELVGGSADLTGSNLTKTPDQQPISKGDFSGSYIYYGVREHAMAAAMNGIALHKGLVPYGGTFLIFTDYCRPSIRLSALMKQQVVYVMTHDSIGLGEDGPTHQPVEHVSSLRAIPNCLVLRPADAIETLESWQIALENTDGPSVLALTRQGVPAQRSQAQKENLVAKGGYILAEAEGELDVTILASGSEVSIAIEARERLQGQGIGARVISMPCTELFDQQEESYRAELLCNDSVKIAVEAAAKLGWERYIGPRGIFIGMESFGESAPANDLYRHFGITTEAVVIRALEALEKNNTKNVKTA